MFTYIPLELHSELPNQNNHVEHPIVYRGARFFPNSPDNFVPSLLENHKREKSFRSQRVSIDDYSVSVFLTEEQLEKTISRFTSMDKAITHIGVGNTNIVYGYSELANSYGHINYYLFDYLSNNPYNEFTLKEREVAK